MSISDFFERQVNVRSALRRRRVFGRVEIEIEAAPRADLVRGQRVELTATSIGFAEASAMKLYAARAAVEVAMEAVQVYGGNGYMSEYQVEQLARDAKVLQIYAGTDEIQITAIARDLDVRCP